MKWNGEKFEEALNDDLDNLLSQKDRRELSDQIESDREYQNNATLYYLMRDLLQDISKQDEHRVVPAGFTESVMREVSNSPAYSQPVKYGSVHKIVRYGLGVAACLFGLSIVLWQPSDKIGESLERVRPSTLVADSAGISAGTSIESLAAEVKILQATGQVQVFKDNGFVWQSLDRGVSINIRDKVRTLAGASLHLAYEDGVELKLKANSLIELEDDGLRVFHGDSWVHVKRKGRQFQTHTPNLVASVRGTIYDVSVKYSQQSYSEFIGDVTNKNVLKGTDPALYFRDVSLDTLNEMGNRHFAGAVESNVRVYESSVDVTPVDPVSGTGGSGVILQEGQQIQLISVANSLDQSKVRRLGREDFHYWGMQVPQFVDGDQSNQAPSNSITEGKATRETGKPTPLLDKPDVDPVDAMNQLNR